MKPPSPHEAKPPKIIWKSSVRPRLGRIYGRARPFLKVWAAFTLAFIIGAQFASWVFLQLLSLLIMPVICVPAGLILATLFWILSRNRRSNRALSRGAVCTILGVFTTLVVLHFVHSSPKRFAFLREDSFAFSVPPGFVPTYTDAVYTFQGEPAKVMEQAHAELAAQGYQIRVSRTEWSADRSYRVRYPGSEWPVPNTVTIRAGRATEPRFHFDAYDTHVEPDRGWVTVEICQPEILPLWLRVFVP